MDTTPAIAPNPYSMPWESYSIEELMDMSDYIEEELGNRDVSVSPTFTKGTYVRLVDDYDQQLFVVVEHHPALLIDCDPRGGEFVFYRREDENTIFGSPASMLRREPIRDTNGL